MDSLDQSRILARLQELVAIHGKRWGIISEIMEKEGIRDKGSTLSSNALRKRFKKLTGAEQHEESERVSTQEQGRYGFEDFQKSRKNLLCKQFDGGASAPVGSPEDAIANLTILNHQLLEQVRESNRMMSRLEKRLEEQEQKTSHTGGDTEQPVSTRDLLELLREITSRREQQMHVIKEPSSNYVSREEVQEMLEETVQEQIDAELRIILSDEGSTARDLSRLIDRRLKSLFSGGEPVVKTAHAGPGRGKKGKTHKKFSASLEETLFERVKSLPGQFSGHLSNALEAYLAVMGEKEEEE